MAVPQWKADNVTEVVVQSRWTNARPINTIIQVRREEDSPVQSARDVLNNWQDHIVPLFANNVTLVGCKYTDHNELEGATGILNPDPAKPTVGPEAGSTLPPNVCALIHKNIAGIAGRRSGRMYLPSPIESSVDEDGIILASTITGWTTRLNSFFDGLSGADDNELVVVHHGVAGYSPSEDADVSIVTGLRLDPLIATQRRRVRR